MALELRTYLLVLYGFILDAFLPPSQIIAVITPYLVDADKANLGPKVFFLWGSLCFCAFVYTYFLIPETKGLSLEQVDKMMEETNPRTSAAWKPHSTFADEMGLTIVTDEKVGVAPEVSQVEV